MVSQPTTMRPRQARPRQAHVNVEQESSGNVSEEEYSSDQSIHDVDRQDDAYNYKGNTGMAAVMAKILKRETLGDAPTIMSKAISEKQLAARKRRHIEQSLQRGDLVEVKSEHMGKVEASDADSPVKKLKRKSSSHSAVKMKLEREELCHATPNPLDRNQEFNLMKIATRGVVQLFNAVKQQQGKIREKVDPVRKSVRKTDKEISKFTSGDFLDRLKSQKVKISTSKTSHQDSYVQEDDAMKQEVKDEPGWNALRDDFMMSSQTLKDWDKDMAPEKNESGCTDLVPSDDDDSE